MRKTKQLNLIEKCLEDHKAEDISSIDVKERTPFADYFVIATCPNVRALGSTADALVDELEKNKYDVRKIEGTVDSGWLLLDAGSIIVHMFLEYKRREVDLDGLIAKSK
ncbi:MAG: ribosome silencing factor [Bacilli bacterium]|nr:ribosome silencing factor [Bacilli bacterium]